MARRVQLIWFQKEVWLYESLFKKMSKRRTWFIAAQQFLFFLFFSDKFMVTVFFNTPWCHFVTDDDDNNKAG